MFYRTGLLFIDATAHLRKLPGQNQRPLCSTRSPVPIPTAAAGKAARVPVSPGPQLRPPRPSPTGPQGHSTGTACGRDRARRLWHREFKPKTPNEQRPRSLPSHRQFRKTLPISLLQ